MHFNPRPPWGGRRYRRPRTAKAKPFQSTPSVGRATTLALCSAIVRFNFNPRPPWGGRRYRERCNGCAVLFQSTPSVGRATLAAVVHIAHGDISIHALRGEGDFHTPPARRRHREFQSTPSVGRATKKITQDFAQKSNFNPRPPWGGRLPAAVKVVAPVVFQSTPSVGRATASDADLTGVFCVFQSTPSVGRATSAYFICLGSSIFQSTPSVGRATTVKCLSAIISVIFQSTPSVGRATRLKS